MGIADTIKGWFSSSKADTSNVHTADVGNTMNSGTTGNSDTTMNSGMDAAKSKLDPMTDKMGGGIDAAGNKIDDMTGGKAGGMIDKGTDAAKDAMNNIGKQNP